jgi:hypothetical protein
MATSCFLATSASEVDCRSAAVHLAGSSLAPREEACACLTRYARDDAESDGGIGVASG